MFHHINIDFLCFFSLISDAINDTTSQFLRKKDNEISEELSVGADRVQFRKCNINFHTDATVNFANRTKRLIVPEELDQIGVT